MPRPDRRDVIFVLMLAVLAFLGWHHYSTGAGWELQVDLALAGFALYSWKPWQRFRR